LKSTSVLTAEVLFRNRNTCIPDTVRKMILLDCGRLLRPALERSSEIAQQVGCLKLGKVSLDGTKIKADASKHRPLSCKYVCKLEAYVLKIPRRGEATL